MFKNAVETTSSPPVPELGVRLKWDDPEKTGKLLAYLRKWSIRLSFMDVCEIFGATVRGEPKVRAYLMHLVADGTLAEPFGDLYCLPHMTQEDSIARRRMIEDGTVERVFRTGLARTPREAVAAARPTVAPYVLRAHASMPVARRSARSDAEIARELAGCGGWLLRWLATRGGFMTHGAIVGAAVRAEVATQLEAALALRNLLTLGYVLDQGFVMTLTGLGERGAEIAGREAQANGEPAIPIPLEFLTTLDPLDDA